VATATAGQENGIVVTMLAAMSVFVTVMRNVVMPPVVVLLWIVILSYITMWMSVVNLNTTG
jgi:hypothetical protein